MIAARKSTLLLLLVCAVSMDHSGVVLAQEGEGTTVTAAAPAAADSHHDAGVTGVASPGGESNVTGPTTEAPIKAEPTTSTPPSTEAPATTTATTPMPTPMATPSTTMSPSTASSTTMASTVKATVPGAHNQVAANTTTPAPATTTPKPSSASMGAVLSVATLVFGLCLVYM